MRRGPLLRTLCACVPVMNLTRVGAFALWVLYAQERLGLGGFGFGVHTMVWGTAAVTSRQRATPDSLLVPFWSAAVGVGVLTLVAWRPLGAADRD